MVTSLYGVIMKIDAYGRKCAPTVTAKRMEQFPGKGIAFIRENTPNPPLTRPEAYGWTEIKDSDIAKFARLGYDIWYKTASRGGAHRVYRSLKKAGQK